MKKNTQFLLCISSMLLVAGCSGKRVILNAETGSSSCAPGYTASITRLFPVSGDAIAGQPVVWEVNVSGCEGSLQLTTGSGTKVFRAPKVQFDAAYSADDSMTESVRVRELLNGVVSGPSVTAQSAPFKVVTQDPSVLNCTVVPGTYRSSATLSHLGALVSELPRFSIALDSNRSATVISATSYYGIAGFNQPPTPNLTRHNVDVLIDSLNLLNVLTIQIQEIGNPASTAECSVPVRVDLTILPPPTNPIAPPPAILSVQVDGAANAKSVAAFSSVLLRVDATGAQSCQTLPAATPVLSAYNPSGTSMATWLTPVLNETTVYSITCTGAGGTSSPSQATITISNPYPVTGISVLFDAPRSQGTGPSSSCDSGTWNDLAPLYRSGQPLNATLGGFECATRTKGWQGDGSNTPHVLRLGWENDHARLANDDRLKNLTQGSLMAWIKTNVRIAGFAGVLVKLGAWGINLQDGLFGAYDYGNSEQRSTRVDLVDGLWHHVAMVWVNRATGTGGTHLYVDGVKRLDNTTTKISSQDTALFLGAANAGTTTATFSFDGDLAHAAVYSRQFTDAEVAGHYRALCLRYRTPLQCQ